MSFLLNGKIFYSEYNENLLKHNNFTIFSDKNSLYDNIFISVSDTNFTIEPIFEIIEKPIKLIPNNIPFKNHLTLIYEDGTDQITNGGIYNYDKKNNQWIYMENNNTKNSSNKSKIKTQIYSGGIFATLNEKISPLITNISPSSGSNYKSNDLNEISFKTIDEHSKINYETIVVKIDDISLIYEYIPYRDLIRCHINKKLNPGNHTFYIFVEDKLGNSISKKGQFKIE